MSTNTRLRTLAAVGHYLRRFITPIRLAFKLSFFDIRPISLKQLNQQAARQVEREHDLKHSSVILGVWLKSPRREDFHQVGPTSGEKASPINLVRSRIPLRVGWRSALRSLLIASPLHRLRLLSCLLKSSSCSAKLSYPRTDGADAEIHRLTQSKRPPPETNGMSPPEFDPSETKSTRSGYLPLPS